MADLNDILNGAEDEDVSEAAAETPEIEDEAAGGQPRDDHGRFASKGENPEPAPAPVPAASPAAEDDGDPNELIPRKAYLEERRRRQEAEQRLSSQPAPTPQPAAEEPAPRRQSPQETPVPVVFDDEYAQSIFAQAVAHVRQEMAPQLTQLSTRTQIDMQRMVARSAHDDFDQVEAAFFELAESNPALVQEINRQPNPVEAAYRYTKSAQEVRQIGSLDMAAIKKAAVEEYLAEQAKAQPLAPQAIPTSLADEQSARTQAAPAPGAPLSLDQIIGR